MLPRWALMTAHVVDGHGDARGTSLDDQFIQRFLNARPMRGVGERLGR